MSKNKGGKDGNAGKVKGSKAVEKKLTELRNSPKRAPKDKDGMETSEQKSVGYTNSSLNKGGRRDSVGLVSSSSQQESKEQLPRSAQQEVEEEAESFKGRMKRTMSTGAIG